MRLCAEQNDIYVDFDGRDSSVIRKFEKSLFNSEELWTITKTTVDIVKTIGKLDKGIWDLNRKNSILLSNYFKVAVDRE
jgi:hypothetical protein